MVHGLPTRILKGVTLYRPNNLACMEAATVRGTVVLKQPVEGRELFQFVEKCLRSGYNLVILLYTKLVSTLHHIVACRLVLATRVSRCQCQGLAFGSVMNGR